MPDQEISDFTPSSSITTNNIIHTKNVVTNNDEVMTVAQVIEVANFDTVPVPPVSNEAAETSDRLLFSNSSKVGNPVEMLPISTILAAAQVPTVSGTLLSEGDFSIGALDMKWGQVLLNTNSPTFYPFPVAFSSSCFIVMTTSLQPNGGKPINVSSYDETGFTLDRDFVDGGAPVLINYFALGV